MHDIENRKDIEFLVDTFYKQVMKDDLIGIYFTEVIALNLEKHMPIMYDFWETNLLGHMKYKGNPMTKHLALSKKQAIAPIHFERWLSLWEATVTEHFKGPKAEDALVRARNIAELMKFKIQQQSY